MAFIAYMDEGDVNILACDAILDYHTSPFTVVILLLNGLHSHNQSNENGYLSQNN